MPNNIWPKVIPELTHEERLISDDFMLYWQNVMPNKFSYINNFNHGYVIKTRPREFSTTLEIGCGNGEHLESEMLDEVKLKGYYGVDFRLNMITEFNKSYPLANGVLADCQKKLQFDSGYFDRVVAIHVLEHLDCLPDAIKETHRLINKNTGVLQIVIPCEGGLAYTIGRKLTSQRIFESRYGVSYKWFIEREHINNPREILFELNKYFVLKDSRYFPMGLKMEFCNLCIGAILVPR
jgi:ubiquinone/menaquinone biosynthesis C-methylase UbiE